MWPQSRARSDAIRSVADERPDWAKVFRVAVRHRVIGLVHNGLTQAGVNLPAEISRSLGDRASSQLRQNLLFAAEIVRLHRQFASVALPVTFFKGVPASIEIYGDLGIRHGKDLDLLVTREAMRDAGEVLARAGYGRVAPPADLDAARLRTLMITGKDFVYQRRDNPDLEVELHWRLFNNSRFLARMPARSRLRQFAQLDNVTLRTFVDDDLFVYLCAHGAAFAWCRLKWLADVAALLARSDDMERLYKAAASRGTARPAAQAILLCKRLLGLEVSDELTESLRRDRAVRLLERLALRAMTQGGAETEPYDLPRGMRPVAFSLWLLDGSPSYLWGEINSRWISWDDVVDVPLPARLQFLYPVLRLPLWVGRRLRGRAHPLA